TLDLAVGFGERSGSAATRNQIFLNDGRARFARDDVQYFGSGADRTYAVALADLDDNGSLDFIAANYGERHRIYFAQAGTPQLVFAQAQGGESRPYNSLALGDLDGNGTLDAVAGVNPEGQLSYLGEVRKRFGIAATTMSLALADLDGDNDLDVIAGNASGQPNYVYYNDGGGSFVDEPLALGNALSDTWGVAVGDLNSDQWLDIVAGSKRQSAIYLNDGKGGFPVTPTQTLGSPTDPTTSVVVGDLNGDGWSDIVVGNENAPNAVYLNDRTGQFPVQPSQRFGSEFESTKSLALGDLDGDRDLDLVVANFFAPNVVYFNDGKGSFSTERATYLGTLDYKTYSVALADFDGDGALDIVAGAWATSSDIWMLALDNVIYLNDGQGGFTDARTVVLTRGKHYTRAVAVGDINGDGKPDIVFADRYNPNDGSGRLMFLTNRRRGDARADAQTIRLVPSGPITDVQGLAITHTLAYSLTAPNGGCDFRGMLEVSLDDKASWPITTVVTVSQNISQSNISTAMTATRVLTWSLPVKLRDQWRDDIDLRLVLTSTVKPCPNGLPGQFTDRREGYVRIPIDTPLQEITNAQVYRQAVGERLATRLSDPFGSADLNHYDRLFALWPVMETTQTVTLSPSLALTQVLSVTRASLLYTSAPIIPASDSSSQKAMPRVTTGIITVSAPGTQTLTIASSNPLLLFNLSVALEWDAHNDRQYVERLTADLVRASELLYDWTNGQAALGQISLTHDAMQQTANGSNAWLDADVRIHATNRLRPNATQGGIVSAVISDPLKSDIAYGPGAVEIGAAWNRFGDAAAGNLDEDWPRALAHELGHLLFFLDDNYLGLDDKDLLKPVGSCTGVMADPYREDDDRGNGEFH
ncbi:MAG: VCBS repeat-containing protein, partial [Anaerolineae bacterium]